MRAVGVAACLLVGVGACATPGQVRRVETQVAILDRDHARADSARAAELARVQGTLRRGMDSIYLLVSQLNDGIQRVSREDAANFENLQQRLYQVANVASNTQSNVRRLGAQIETAVSAAPPVTADTTHGATGLIPQPDVLLTQASQQMERSAFSSARIPLVTLLQTYPSSAQVPEAAFMMGRSFDPTEPDSARWYYTRVWKTYPDSPLAPTSLYKLGMLELKAQNTSAARGYFQQIVDRYKSSDEFELARTRLRENP
jgi:TolA-binding protein